MIRATTGGVLKSYRSNLMNSFIGLNKSRDTALTQRTFNSYAEDPSAAARAFRLRKARMAVESQYDICNGAISKYQSAFSCLDTIDKLLDTANGGNDSTLKSTTLEMLNDPKGDARVQLTKVLDQLSESVVQNMNQTYGENFIFAGADGHNVPFEVKDNKLYYRGVPVDASEPRRMTDPATGDPIESADGNSYVLASARKMKVKEFQETTPGTPLEVTLESGAKTNVLAGATPLSDTDYDELTDEQKAEYVKVDNGGTEEYYKFTDLASKQSYDDRVANDTMKDAGNNPYEVEVDGEKYYILEDPSNYISKKDFEAAKADADKLKYLVNEKQFVDIGLGFQESDGKLIESSGFDVALNGLSFLGYGLDEDGDPQNIYSIVQKLKDIAGSVPDGGTWSKEVYEEFRGLVGKLEAASSKYKTEFTNHTASTTKLENNLKLLEDNHYTLQEQYSELEDVDMADAITSFLWAQYCYNAALKVGNSVLGQSLMDYLN